MYTRSSAGTRRITNELRELAHYLIGRARYYANNADVTGRDSWWEARPYNKTYGSFALEHQSQTRAGCPVVIYPERGEYWIRPTERAGTSTHLVDVSLREMAAETRYLDALFDVLEADGWTPMRGSETRDSLAAWRAARAPRETFIAGWNMPGCLPDTAEPLPEFDNTVEAWEYIADEIGTCQAEVMGEPYSETELELIGFDLGTIDYLHTGSFHLAGLVYFVQRAEPGQ